MWLLVADALGSRFRILAPDLPGHGALSRGRFTLRTAVERVRAVAGEEGFPVMLAGDSLGGYVALAAGAAMGDRVSGIVACGCSMNPTGATAASLVAQALRLRATGLLRSRAKALQEEEELIRRAHPAAPLDEIFAAGLSPRTRADALLSCAGRDFIRMLGAVTAPVLIVNSQGDTAARRDEASFVAAARRGQLMHLESRGHGASLAAPEAFAQAVAAFAAGTTT